MACGEDHPLQQHHILQTVTQPPPVIRLALDKFELFEQCSHIMYLPQVLVHNLFVLEQPAMQKLYSRVPLFEDLSVVGWIHEQVGQHTPSQVRQRKRQIDVEDGEALLASALHSLARVHLLPLQVQVVVG